MPRLAGDEERFVLLAMHQTLVRRGHWLRQLTGKGQPAGRLGFKDERQARYWLAQAFQVLLVWLFAFSSGTGIRIRGHPMGPPSAQELIMISPPSAQEDGTIPRRLEHKSSISKLLETKPRFTALASGGITELS